MRSITKFYANDGTEFSSAEAAMTHEMCNRLRDEFGWPDSTVMDVILYAGRLHYLLGEYLKQFPEK